MDAADIDRIVEKLRADRDKSQWPLRTFYNEAIDRLDVLASQWREWNPDWALSPEEDVAVALNISVAKHRPTSRSSPMDAYPASYVTHILRREPKTDAERSLLKEIQTIFIVYDFTEPDRIALGRAIIGALEAAEKIGKDK